MSYVIGATAEVLLNNVGYHIVQGSYVREKPRIHRNRITKAGISKFVDYGPLFNDFKFTIVISPNFANIDGSLDNRDPKAVRDGLWSLYGQSNNKFLFQSPNNETFTVIFLDLKERHPEQTTYYYPNPGQQNVLGLTDYLLDVELLEVS